MQENAPISRCTVKQYKVHHAECNNDNIENRLNRNFNQKERTEVIASDLTYVNTYSKWNYIYLMLYLYNREIVRCAVGKNKIAKLFEKHFIQ